MLNKKGFRAITKQGNKESLIERWRPNFKSVIKLFDDFLKCVKNEVIKGFCIIFKRSFVKDKVLHLTMCIYWLNTSESTRD